MTAKAFDELFRKHYPEIFCHCQRIVNNKEDAEELAEDTFVKANLNIAKFNPNKANFRTWIFTIATNTSLDFLRSGSQKKQKQTQSLDELVLKEDGSPDPVEQSEYHQLMEFINECLHTLPAQQRIAVSLRHLQEFTLQEIAQIIGKSSPNTVRNRIKLGEKKMKKCLEDKGIDDYWC